MALHLVAENALDELLRCWRRHNDLQQGAAPVTKLAASRQDLDRARDRMHRIREVIYPNSIESGEVLVTTLCTSLDEVVHLNWRHRSPDRPGEFVCVCGERLASTGRAITSR